ncbi:hypothetical protein EMCRGX_G034562 [Ephydatia muelleri]
MSHAFKHKTVHYVTASATKEMKTQSLPFKIRTVHVVAALGALSVLLGYICVAPPSELPSWPRYSLNAKVWQSFEKWTQHVKPHHVRIVTMALQHIESRALYILAFLRVPDLIDAGGGALTCEEIKMAVDKASGYGPVNLQFLCRLLHAAAHFDLLKEADEEKQFVKLYSGDEALVISTALSRSIFSGESGFKETYRRELLDYLQVDISLQEIYDAGVADDARLTAPAIIADYPSFSSCKHICDIGGGLGSFLQQILAYYSFGIKGTNFDLPEVIRSARDFLKGEHADQITLVAGNFSDNIPTFGCDCYILKDILQNWSDEDAAGILKKLRKVVAVGNRLLVIERVMHTGSYPEERVKALMDLTMMAFNPSHSRLRSQEELFYLLEDTGFGDAQTYHTRAGFSIIEVYPTIHPK